MVGDKIRYYRRKKGMTQAELAKRLGTAHMIISNYERGIYNPGFKRLTEIADALDVTTDDLTFLLQVIARIIKF